MFRIKQVCLLMKTFYRRATEIVAIIFAVGMGAGCLLDETQCGSGWVSKNGVCIPERPAGAYYGGSPNANVVFETETTVDMAIAPSETSLLPDDMVPPDKESEGVRREAQDERWAEYSVILCVDQSAPSPTAQMGSTAGIDLDAVLIIGADGQTIGFAQRVVEGVLTPPRSNSEPPRELTVTLGEPDGRAVSLGGNGAYVRHDMALQRGIRSGDVVQVVDVESGSTLEEIAEVYLCKRGSRGLSTCEILGRNDLDLESTFLIP